MAVISSGSLLLASPPSLLPEAGPGLSGELAIRSLEGLIRSRCRRWLVPGYEHEDLVSEALLVVWTEALPTWDPRRSALGTWSTRLVDRKLASLKRRALRGPE